MFSLYTYYITIRNYAYNACRIAVNLGQGPLIIIMHWLNKMSFKNSFRKCVFTVVINQRYIYSPVLVPTVETERNGVKNFMFNCIIGLNGLTVYRV